MKARSAYGAYKQAQRTILKQRPTAKQIRTSSYGDDWSSISATCLKLANYTCSCGLKANRAHHIIPLSKGGSNAQFNLKAVCEVCHKKYHKHLR
jgi:5-methylcytosine-specific restriction endonuclease McrA